MLPQHETAARSRSVGAGLFHKRVLVLCVADDEPACCIFVSDDELKAIECGVDRQERDRAVVVLPRCDTALPLADVEDGLVVCREDLEVAERTAHIAEGEVRYGG